jgi:hypothetical protein
MCQYKHRWHPPRQYLLQRQFRAGGSAAVGFREKNGNNPPPGLFACVPVLANPTPEDLNETC